jgi:integrase
VSGDSPYLFLDSNGEPLTVNALTRVLRRAGERADIPRVHLHLLRHTFATNYLVKEVGDPLRLQSILGHETLEMVRRYVSSANIQRSLLDRRASPMDLIAGARKATPQSRLRQPRRRRGLRIVK